MNNASDSARHQTISTHEGHIPIPTNKPRTPSSKNTLFPNIRWENFNYPPLLKLIHYDITELDGPYKSVVKKLNLSFLLTVIVDILNFINSVAQTAAGYSGLRILYSILNILIFWPVTLLAFYKGYRGLVFNKRELKFYWILHPILACVFIVFSIVHEGNYNGWIRVRYLFEEKDIFQGILGIIESLIYEFNAILIVYCLWNVRKLTRKGPQEDRL